MQYCPSGNSIFNQDSSQEEVWYHQECEGCEVIPIYEAEQIVFLVFLILALKRDDLLVHKESEVEHQDSAVYVAHGDYEQEAREHHDRRDRARLDAAELRFFLFRCRGTGGDNGLDLYRQVVR